MEPVDIATQERIRKEIVLFVTMICNYIFFYLTIKENVISF